MKETPKQFDVEKQYCIKRLLETVNSLNSEQAEIMKHEVYNIMQKHNLPMYEDKHPIAWVWTLLLYKEMEVEKDEALTLSAEG